MTNDEAFSELVAARQLMNRRERTDRRERAQSDQRPGARPRTEPLQHLRSRLRALGFVRNAFGNCENDEKGRSRPSPKAKADRPNH